MAKISKEEIKQFVKEYLTEANSSRIECGDGRYTPEQSDGAIRAFGGDFGMVMALAGALKDEGTLLSADEIVARYLLAVKKIRGEETKLYHHTDTQNHAKGEMGCGHVAKASSPDHDGMYGSLTSEDVRVLYKSFSENPESNLTILEGEHKERAVLFVHGGPDDTDIHYSVNSMDAAGNMYFVVDMDRVDRFIGEVVPVFSEGLQTPVSVESVRKNFLKQMQATADILAPNLDRFNVEIDSRGNVSVDEFPDAKASLQV